MSRLKTMELVQGQYKLELSYKICKILEFVTNSSYGNKNHCTNW